MTNHIIGLLGLDFESGNLGCCALGYGFLEILDRVALNLNKKIKVVIFKKCDINKIIANNKFDNLHLISQNLPGVRKIKDRKTIIESFKKCKMIFDFTAGDSFSDIYGKKRFFQRTIVKHLVIKSNTPLILGSQTYGPYKNFFVRKYASYIFKNSKNIFSRDSYSKKTVKNIADRESIQTIDVAFALPFNKKAKVNKKIRVGFNPSGLLWDNSCIENNKFGLIVNYKKYCYKIIEYLRLDPSYEVILIPHVTSKVLDDGDNDLLACNSLNKLFDNINIAPHFETPTDAKSYISSCDIFIGARMHATIAAFSSGVACIPFSYSYKFEGVYNDLNYNYVISARTMNTETAIIQTIKYIQGYKELEKEVEKSNKIIESEITFLVNKTEEVIANI